jgi:hypothetical protein
LAHSSERDLIGRSSSKDCSRSARPLRTSQAITGMKIEYNWDLEERIRAKEIKNIKVLINF